MRHGLLNEVLSTDPFAQVMTFHPGRTGSPRIAQEEIFGPVLTAIPFSDEADAIKDEADAIKIANDVSYKIERDRPRRGRLEFRLLHGDEEHLHCARHSFHPEARRLTTNA